MMYDPSLCFGENSLVYNISGQISQEKIVKKHEEKIVRVKSLSAKQKKTAGCWGDKLVMHSRKYRVRRGRIILYRPEKWGQLCKQWLINSVKSGGVHLYYQMYSAFIPFSILMPHPASKWLRTYLFENDKGLKHTFNTPLNPASVTLVSYLKCWHKSMLT